MEARKKLIERYARVFEIAARRQALTEIWEFDFTDLITALVDAVAEHSRADYERNIAFVLFQRNKICHTMDKFNDPSMREAFFWAIERYCANDTKFARDIETALRNARKLNE